jgi:hypothetical protein
VLGVSVLGAEDGLELGKELGGMVSESGIKQELEPKDALPAEVKVSMLAVNVPS